MRVPTLLVHVVGRKSGIGRLFWCRMHIRRTIDGLRAGVILSTDWDGRYTVQCSL